MIAPAWLPQNPSWDEFTAPRDDLRGLGRLVMNRDGNLAPLALVEAQDAQGAPDEVADEDREPDVDGVQRRRLLDDETDPERDDDLRRDRDVERTLGIASSLESAGVC